MAIEYTMAIHRVRLKMMLKKAEGGSDITSLCPAAFNLIHNGAVIIYHQPWSNVPCEICSTALTGGIDILWRCPCSKYGPHKAFALTEELLETQMEWSQNDT